MQDMKPVQAVRCCGLLGDDRKLPTMEMTEKQAKHALNQHLVKNYAKYDFSSGVFVKGRTAEQILDVSRIWQTLEPVVGKTNNCRRHNSCFFFCNFTMKRN